MSLQLLDKKKSIIAGFCNMYSSSNIYRENREFFFNSPNAALMFPKCCPRLLVKALQVVNESPIAEQEKNTIIAGFCNTYISSNIVGKTVNFSFNSPNAALMFIYL